MLGWLQQQLTEILNTLPAPLERPAYLVRLAWQSWQVGLRHPFRFVQPPPLRLLLVMDNLIGHKNPIWLKWCCTHGILSLYTPLGGSWLNMTESIQRLFKRRALDGQTFLSPQPMIQALEDVAAHWNTQPTPFIWAGKRKARRSRTASTIHRLGAFGAATSRTIRRFYARLRAV